MVQHFITKLENALETRCTKNGKLQYRTEGGKSHFVWSPNSQYIIYTIYYISFANLLNARSEISLLEYSAKIIYRKKYYNIRRVAAHEYTMCNFLFAFANTKLQCQYVAKSYDSVHTAKNKDDKSARPATQIGRTMLTRLDILARKCHGFTVELSNQSYHIEFGRRHIHLHTNVIPMKCLLVLLCEWMCDNVATISAFYDLFLLPKLEN